MKDLRITKFFTVDELVGIYNAARAQYETDHKDAKGKEKEMFMMFLFADYTHTAYILHQSPEYMDMYIILKEICEAKGDTAFLRIWEGMCLNMALHNPELEVADILRKCASNLGDILKD